MTTETEIDAPFGRTTTGLAHTHAYYALIGPSPHCEPGDRATALAYATRIEQAIQRGRWHPYESTRLRKLRAKWVRRAIGQDKRFNLVGTKGGRLPTDVEASLGRGRHGRGNKKDTPHPHYVDVAERNRGEFGFTVRTKKQSRPTEEQLQAWQDADLPQGKAKGTSGSIDPDNDVFEPEPGEIELPVIPAARQYLIPGQDTKGHAHRVYCRVMPAHYRALCALERSKQFGFRTIGDVIRWCVDHGVRELTARGRVPQALSALAQVDAIREVLLDEQYYLEFPQLFELMTTIINKHLSAGAEKEAVRLIAIVRHQIEQMGEEYWREKFMEELMKHYGTYLDGSRQEATDFGDQ